MRHTDENTASAREGAHLPEPLRIVTEALERLRFGVIQLTIHDGKPVQVDVTERRRFGN